MLRLLLWVLAIGGYGYFFHWYTNFDGPLNANEIQQVIEVLEERGGDPNGIEVIRKFMETDDGKSFYMLNLIDINDTPEKMPRFPVNATGTHLLDHYMEHMWPALLSRASHPLIANQTLGSAIDAINVLGATEWQQVALFRYRSRRDIVNIIVEPEFFDRHEYKLAALSKTLAVPISAPVQTDLRLLLGLFVLSLTLLLHILLRPRD